MDDTKKSGQQRISIFWGESFFKEPQIQFLPQFDTMQHVFPIRGYWKEDSGVGCNKAWEGGA